MNDFDKFYKLVAGIETSAVTKFEENDVDDFHVQIAQKLFQVVSSFLCNASQVFGQFDIIGIENLFIIGFKVPITPKNVFRLKKSWYFFELNGERIIVFA